MATRQEIEQALLDVLADVLATEFDTSRDDVYSHVGIEGRATNLDLPGYTFELFETDEGYGMHGNPHVVDTTLTDDGLEVTYTRRKEATVDIIAHSADGDSRGVNRLYDAVDRQLTRFEHRFASTDTLHEDVEHAELSVRGTQDVSQPGDNIRGDRLRVLVPYHRYYEGLYPLIEEVEQDVDTDDIIEEIEQNVDASDD